MLCVGCQAKNYADKWFLGEEDLNSSVMLGEGLGQKFLNHIFRKLWVKLESKTHSEKSDKISLNFSF